MYARTQSAYAANHARSFSLARAPRRAQGGGGMAVAFKMKFEGATLEQYDRVMELMGLDQGDTSPEGAVFHWVAADRRRDRRRRRLGDRRAVQQVRRGADRPVHAAGRDPGPAGDHPLRGAQHARRRRRREPPGQLRAGVRAADVRLRPAVGLRRSPSRGDSAVGWLRAEYREGRPHDALSGRLP